MQRRAGLLLHLTVLDVAVFFSRSALEGVRDEEENEVGAEAGERRRRVLLLPEGVVLHEWGAWVRVEHDVHVLHHDTQRTFTTKPHRLQISSNP